MNDNKTIIHFCTVISTEDENCGDRIKVAIKGVDDGKKLEDIPFCFPLQPKMIHIKPHVGECVIVFLQEQNSYGGDRLYIGPVISQPYFMEYEDADIARTLLSGESEFTPLRNPNTNSENYGTLPEGDDVALEGRGNSDLILKKNEVRLRCGHKKENNGNSLNSLLANKIDPAYIQMQYKHRKDEKNTNYNSSINLVGDRINILSHDSKVTFKPTNFDQSKSINELISDEEMNKLLSTAHPLIYGDELVTFLKQLIKIIQTHVHPYSCLPPSLDAASAAILNQDLDSMLSKSIKIN